MYDMLLKKQRETVDVTQSDPVGSDVISAAEVVREMIAGLNAAEFHNKISWSSDRITTVFQGGF